MSIFKISDVFSSEVTTWKKHYGIRVVGETTDQKKVVNGLDVFKHVSSLGFDLELTLLYFKSNNIVVDWLSFAKAATVEDWMIDTILKKISYPIKEVYGQEYWNGIEARIKYWFIGYMLK